jgi:hypothetical protein
MNCRTFIELGMNVMETSDKEGNEKEYGRKGVGKKEE